jgi:hypothetical protein
MLKKTFFYYLISGRNGYFMLKKTFSIINNLHFLRENMFFIFSGDFAYSALLLIRVNAEKADSP